MTNHEVATVAQAGWSGKKNGELLRLAATRFDVFITADQNLQYQQNLAALPIAVVVLKAVRSDLETLGPLVPRVLSALEDLPARTLLVIEGT